MKDLSNLEIDVLYMATRERMSFYEIARLKNISEYIAQQIYMHGMKKVSNGETRRKNEEY